MNTYFQDIFEGLKTFIGGLKLTMHHYRNRKELVCTLQYPHEKWPVPERKIGFELEDYNAIRSRLNVEIDDCIGCLSCQRACPVDCIKIETFKVPKDTDFDAGVTSNGTQKKMYVAIFSIDLTECMFCNLCTYPCPEDCIYMVGGPNSHRQEVDYEFSKRTKEELIFQFAERTEEEILKAGGEKYLAKKKGLPLPEPKPKAQNQEPRTQNPENKETK